MTAYNVYLNGSIIDTVFDNETDRNEVKRSLIGHDGYDPSIIVRKAKGQKTEKPKTAYQQQKSFIEKYILDCICSDGYDQEPKTDAEKLEFLVDCFRSEYGHEIDRQGPHGAFGDWIMGLPSSFCIVFSNYDILELAKKQGTLPENATEKQEDVILEKYPRYITMRTFELYRKLTGKTM